MARVVKVAYCTFGCSCKGVRLAKIVRVVCCKGSSGEGCKFGPGGEFCKAYKARVVRAKQCCH